MTAACFEYFFHGCRLRSAIPLPSLAEWPESTPGTMPDIRMTLGAAPRHLDDLLWSSPFIQVSRDKSALVSIAAVARFYLPHGRDIVVQPAPGAQSGEVEAIFVSTVAGLVLHRRNLLPLHASCVVHHGRALAISGVAGHGKSALAAALVQRGATLLADDLCVLRLENHSVHAVGSCKHSRLWPDVMNHLRIPEDQRLTVRLHHGKHAVAMPATEPGSYPLTHFARIAIFGAYVTPEIVSLHGPGSVLPPRNLIFQRDIGHLLGDASFEFRTLTALARQVRILSLRRTQLLEHLDRCADLLLAAIEGGA